MGIQCSYLNLEEEVSELRSFIIHKLEGKDLDLPLLPIVAHQVLLVSGDPQADSKKLSSLIQQDQALAGQILRMANSPAYSPRSPIVSLQQAITWLGMNMLAGLAFSVSVQKGVFNTTGYEKEVQGLWRQALATGLYGKEIARRIRHNVENAFLCGLLHGIGKPAMLHLLAQDPQRNTSPLRWPVIETLFEEFHIQAGIALADSWQLPEPVKESILYYPDDQYHKATSPTKGAVITCLADHLASWVLETTSMEEDRLRTLPVVQDLNFYPEDISALLEFQHTVRESVECFLI